MGKIQFKEDTHIYVNTETGEIYTSCTTFLKNFEEPFDAVNISINYAKKHGETPEFWQAQWKEKGRDSAEKGTEYHSLRENEFEERAKNGEKVFMNKLVDGVKYSIDDLAKLQVGIHSEVIVFSEKYGIAGQIDKLEIFEDKTFDILDFKTVKKLDFKSFYNPKTGGHKYMYHPINHLHSCNYVKFCLQTGIYAMFLEDVGFKCKELAIEEVKNNNKIHILPYYKEDIYNMLNYSKPKEEFNIYNFI